MNEYLRDSKIAPPQKDNRLKNGSEKLTLQNPTIIFKETKEVSQRPRSTPPGSKNIYRYELKELKKLRESSTKQLKLETMDLKERNKILFPRLYPVVIELHPQEISVIIPILLEIELSELLNLLENSEALNEKIDEIAFNLNNGNESNVVENESNDYFSTQNLENESND